MLALQSAARRTLLLTSAILTAIFISQGTFSYSNPWVFTAGFTLLAAACAGVLTLTLCATPLSRLSRVMSSRTLRMFGRYSYALYVFHQPVIMVVDALAYRLLPGADSLAMQIVRYTVVLPLSLAAALASWNLYEKHFLRLKRYFHTEKAAPGASVKNALT